VNFIPFALRSFLGGGGPARFRDVVEKHAEGRINELVDGKVAGREGRERHFQQFRLEDAIVNLLPSQWLGKEG
jgi:hypothetical protein